MIAASTPAGVSAETPAPVPGDPADPARCHVEDGPAISVSAAQMLGCAAALSWMRHDRGAVLALGRRRRRPSAAIRRAARERDHGRCRFPGCESRRVDLHHIRHWINGGRTDLENLVSLCPWHHQLVHDRGYLIAAPPPGGGGTFAFCRPDGTPLPSCPPLPGPDGPIGQAHDADITPDTIIPGSAGPRGEWSGKPGPAGLRGSATPLEQLSQAVFEPRCNGAGTAGRTAGQAVQATGSRLTPRWKFERRKDGGPAGARTDVRASTSANSARIWLRARWAPRQKCGPWPNTRCGLG